MGNLLVEKRKALGASLAEIQEITGIGMTTLFNWEQGTIQHIKNYYMLPKVSKLADLYDVAPCDITQAVENNYILKHQGHDIGSYHAKPRRIESSGDDDNSSDDDIIDVANFDVIAWIKGEKSIIETAQEAADNLENTEETVTEDKILCSDALAKILDACYDWTQKRQDYDDTRDIILNFMPPYETIKHLTIANTVNSIVDWFASKIYGACTYEQFTKLVDNIRMCLAKKADWDGDSLEEE